MVDYGKATSSQKLLQIQDHLGLSGTSYSQLKSLLGPSPCHQHCCVLQRLPGSFENISLLIRKMGERDSIPAVFMVQCICHGDLWL